MIIIAVGIVVGYFVRMGIEWFHNWMWSDIDSNVIANEEE